MDTEISMFTTALDADKYAEGTGGPGGIGGATFKTEIIAIFGFEGFENGISFGVGYGYFIFF